MTRQALLEQLAERLVRRAAGHPVRVAIDGVDAAGKTTLANDLAPIVAGLGRPVIRVSVDDFHRPASVRRRRVARARQRDGALPGSVAEVERRYRERYVPGHASTPRRSSPSGSLPWSCFTTTRPTRYSSRSAESRRTGSIRSCLR
jgi:hypothetical protein